MGVLDNNLLVGKDDLHCPQGIIGKAAPVRNVSRYQDRVLEIIPSHYNFFAILEKYNPDTCTFFTPVGEMGFAYEVIIVDVVYLTVLLVYG